MVSSLMGLLFFRIEMIETRGDVGAEVLAELILLLFR